MIVKIDRSFEKDTDRIRDTSMLQKINSCIQTLRKVSDSRSIRHLKKLKGYSDHFRIRIGQYRAGVVIKDNTIVFERFLHRKDIYKFFPSS